MKRAINKQLTRAMLEEMGIYKIEWDLDNNQWWIDRYWFKNKSKTIKEHKRIKISEAVCHHKYTQDKKYPIVVFNYEGRVHTYPLARFIYAWFKGEVKDGEVIDHKDNNPFNNFINPYDDNDPRNNLEAVLPEVNLKKRFIDNPKAFRNQYDVINSKKQKSELTNEYLKTQSDLVDLCNFLEDTDLELAKKTLEEVSKCIKEKMC